MLPDDGRRRPRRHLRGDQGKRAARQVRRADWATTGRRCARSAATSRAPTARAQGVVPFLKVVNDTAVAVNQGGKRKGAVCCYLETWHLDIEEFLELRKNTGDDRRRTHDMNTANWIPDLFMKRVMEGGDWTLFSPSDCPDLHDKSGKAFEEAYTRYEDKAARGDLKLFKKVPALQPVAQDAVDAVRDRPSLDHLQGCLQHPLAAAARRRRPQLQPLHRDHAQYLRAARSRCATSARSTCRRTWRRWQGGYELDHAKLKQTISTAMRMLDNVIDINYYAVPKARNSNLRHRPVGLGIMGFQDCLHMMRIPYASEEAVEFADRTMEAVCYYAYWARPNWPRSAAATRPSPGRCGTAASCRRTRSTCCATSAAATSTLDLSARRWTGSALRARIRQHRHAQLQLRRHRADRDDLQHHRRRRLHRADLPEPVREVEPVGRVHGRQRIPGART